MATALRSFETLMRYRGAAMAEFWRALKTLEALQAAPAAPGLPVPARDARPLRPAARPEVPNTAYRTNPSASRNPFEHRLGKVLLRRTPTRPHTPRARRALDAKRTRDAGASCAVGGRGRMPTPSPTLAPPTSCHASGTRVARRVRTDAAPSAPSRFQRVGRDDPTLNHFRRSDVAHHGGRAGDLEQELAAHRLGEAVVAIGRDDEARGPPMIVSANAASRS